MRLLVLALALVLAAPAAAANPPYRALFVKNATWKLPCVKVPNGFGGPSGKATPDGELTCTAADVRTIGVATLVRIDCTGHRASADGWYVMLDRGLYEIDRFAQVDGGPPRPRARWEDFEAPKGTFQASDAAVLRASRPLIPAVPATTAWTEAPHPSGWRGGGSTFAHGGAWCFETNGSNGGGGEGRTVCANATGLAGTAFDKGEAVFVWRCGVLAAP